LENLIQREVLLSDGPLVSLQSLERLSAHAAAPAQLTDIRFQAAKARAIATFERTYIAELLSRTGGNISQAARLSGKERSRLGKLAKKYGIAHNSFRPGE
jgi:DNA-binding NtrC family response regulator